MTKLDMNSVIKAESNLNYIKKDEDEEKDNELDKCDENSTQYDKPMSSIIHDLRPVNNISDNFNEIPRKRHKMEMQNDANSNMIDNMRYQPDFCIQNKTTTYSVPGTQNFLSNSIPSNQLQNSQYPISNNIQPNFNQFDYRNPYFRNTPHLLDSLEIKLPPMGGVTFPISQHDESNQNMQNLNLSNAANVHKNIISNSNRLNYMPMNPNENNNNYGKINDRYILTKMNNYNRAVNYNPYSIPNGYSQNEFLNDSSGIYFQNTTNQQVKQKVSNDKNINEQNLLLSMPISNGNMRQIHTGQNPSPIRNINENQSPLLQKHMSLDQSLRIINNDNEQNQYLQHSHSYTPNIFSGLTGHDINNLNHPNNDMFSTSNVTSLPNYYNNNNTTNSQLLVNSYQHQNQNFMQPMHHPISPINQSQNSYNRQSPTDSQCSKTETEELDTKDLAQRISSELKRYSIPQAVFAQRVLCRSQGTLSDLLRNPKPWAKLKSGRETFRRMNKWLQEPEYQRMSSLRQAACKRKDSDSLQDECTNKKPRLVFTDIQRRTLLAIFKETKRPGKEVQMEIAEKLGLRITTVANFFMNARRRSLDKYNGELDNESMDILLQPCNN
ncbi:hypothetical protein A3Q56_02793 [Intoshia linei]|uniref:One cut domain family member n=1 Tax=Intoshia linei TaxID=1819745 RepID=A0A177B703_9BILA|nr:hypothetical protein A3Q56_02793 [Intoshia linei]